MDQGWRGPQGRTRQHRDAAFFAEVDGGLSADLRLLLLLAAVTSDLNIFPSLIVFPLPRLGSPLEFVVEADHDDDHDQVEAGHHQHVDGGALGPEVEAGGFGGPGCGLPAVVSDDHFGVARLTQQPGGRKSKLKFFLAAEQLS